MRVGEEALCQRGSAVDAVMSAVLAQIVLGGGAVIGFFGILALMNYDAASGGVTSLNAGWNTIAAEDDPLSIPGKLNPAAEGVANMMLEGEPLGRTAMVGGFFMRGLEAALRRFGKLPFARLFDAAIELVEDGFEVSASLSRYIDLRKSDLARLPKPVRYSSGVTARPMSKAINFVSPLSPRRCAASRARAPTICTRAHGRHAASKPCSAIVGRWRSARAGHRRAARP